MHAAKKMLVNVARIHQSGLEGAWMALGIISM
jgi:hypothetical protein